MSSSTIPLSSEALDSPSTFHTKLTIGWIGLVSCAYFIVYILKLIELNKTFKRKPRFGKNIGADTALTVDFTSSEAATETNPHTPPGIHKNHSSSSTGTTNSTNSGGGNDDNDQHNNRNDNDNISVISSTSMMTTTLDTPGHSSEFEAHIHNLASKPPHPSSFEDHEDTFFHDNSDDYYNGTPKFSRSKLTLEEKLILYAMVCLLLFLTYLLLVYLPSGVMASLIGTLCISCVTFKTQVSDEIRRRRYDRLSAILTLIIFGASFLSLITYASVGLKEGIIYEGPARIIGYDTSTYETHGGSGNGEVSATRMDLEVAWGGNWGCPDYNGVECQAFVSGALCEMDQQTNSNRQTKRRRLLLWNKKTNETETSSSKNTTTVEKSETTDTTTNVDNNHNDGEEESMEEMEEEIKELEAENEKLKEKNSELGQEVLVQDQEVVNAVDAAKVYYEKVADEKELVDYYKEEVVEEEEEVVEEAGALLEEEVVADYYANVAIGEEVVLDELGEEGVVEEIEDESLEDYSEEMTVVEEIVDAELEALDEEIEDINEGEDTDVEEEVEDTVIDIEDKVYDTEIDNEVEVNVGMIEEEESGSITYYDEVIGELEEEEMVIEEIIDEEKVDGVDDDEISQEEAEVVQIQGEIIEEEEIKEEVQGYYNDEIEAYEEGTSATNSYSGYNSNNQYSFDDDIFEDEWWSSSWSDVWGEYACNDLFDEDVEGKVYDRDTKPGTDEWPFVNIYGSCNRCEAYLVDYYSTEHFNKIKEYQIHAINYALVGMVGLGVTILLAYRHYIAPTSDRDPENLYGQMV